MASMDMIDFIRNYKDHLGDGSNGPITDDELKVLTKMFCAMHTTPKGNDNETDRR